MNDLLMFRTMLAPILIRIGFVLGVILVMLAGIGQILIASLDENSTSNERLLGALAGVVTTLVGPIVVRLYAEVLIVIFRINETLTEIRG